MHNFTQFPPHSHAKARRFRSCNLLFTIVYYEGGMKQHGRGPTVFNVEAWSKFQLILLDYQSIGRYALDP